MQVARLASGSKSLFYLEIQALVLRLWNCPSLRLVVFGKPNADTLAGSEGGI